MCVAQLTRDGIYGVASPRLVGDLESLFPRLLDRSPTGVLIGFDFPIGLPSVYAEKAGIKSFREALPRFGKGEWCDFYRLAEHATEIGLHRPFYPYRPGGTQHSDLLTGLGTESMTDLLRLCERPTPTRGAASPLFWTLGGKQVGRSAIIGWRDLLGPAVIDPELDLGLWPFDGELSALVGSRRVTVAETYPAEACVHLGMSPPGPAWSKRKQSDRRLQGTRIKEWAHRRGVHLSPDLVQELDQGFGPAPDAEDPFDAALGAFSMIEVSLGHRAAGAPALAAVRSVEGWILGQAPHASSACSFRDHMKNPAYLRSLW